MRVVVLMSTYNGGKYIVEQVTSILQQMPTEGRLMVRDDGSDDKTVNLLQGINDDRISIQIGLNIGFGKSFLTLLMDAPHDLEMVMFSDQDDVWLPDKIQRAWTTLSAFTNTPVLYCSSQILVDDSLQHLERTKPWPSTPSFRNALAENLVTGCTAALNRNAVELLKVARIPNEVYFHDWWMYLVISALGIVTVDPCPTVLYRQHSANHIGHGAGWIGRQRQMIQFLLRHNWTGILLGQVGALKKHYNHLLSSEQKNLLNRYFEISENRIAPRWALILSLRGWRQRKIHELPFRILLLWQIIKISSI
jgi:glycosyltransferase involved in cell wall biosynthesis